MADRAKNRKWSAWKNHKLNKAAAQSAIDNKRRPSWVRPAEHGPAKARKPKVGGGQKGIRKRLDPYGGGEGLCLLESLRKLNVPVEYVGEGPFRALLHGNQMLGSHQKFLQLTKAVDGREGAYIMWRTLCSAARDTFRFHHHARWPTVYKLCINC